MASETPLRRSLLIVGGDADPNITALLSAADRDGVSYRKLLVGKLTHPALTWDIVADTLLLDGEPVECDAAFVRYDVFTALHDGRTSSQYRALAWRAKSTDLAVLRTNVDKAFKDTAHVLLAWTNVNGPEPSMLKIDPASVPAGTRISDGRRPSWSRDGRVIYFGVR
jgi:hypothetical protein